MSETKNEVVVNEANSDYLTLLSKNLTPQQFVSRAGLGYTSAAVAMQLAGRPAIEFVNFDGQPFLACLNGGLVAVDVPLTNEEGSLLQRVWLPLMDADNMAIPLSKITTTIVNNSRQRCLVKAIACVRGPAMSLYLKCDDSGETAAKMLGVTPSTDLAVVTPALNRLEETNASYVEWGVAIAVARITDPYFHWEVLCNAEGMPYREVLGSLMVDVKTTYKGRSMVISLPVMDSIHEPIPADRATVFDWNKAVMRALAKCVAFNSGYALSVYHSEDFGSDEENSGAKGRSRRGASRASKAEPATAATTSAKGSTFPPLEEAATSVKSEKAKTETAAKAKEDPVSSVVTKEADPAVDPVKESTGNSVTEATSTESTVSADQANVAPEQNPEGEANTEVAATETAAPAQAESVSSEAPKAEEKNAETTVAAPVEDKPKEATTEKSVPNFAKNAVLVPPASKFAAQQARFESVVQRSFDGGLPLLLQLFAKLHSSSVYTPEHKPDCLNMLISACFACVKTPSDAISVLDAMTNALMPEGSYYIPNSALPEGWDRTITREVLKVANGTSASSIESCIEALRVVMDSLDVLSLVVEDVEYGKAPVQWLVPVYTAVLKSFPVSGATIVDGLEGEALAYAKRAQRLFVAISLKANANKGEAAIQKSRVRLAENNVIADALELLEVAESVNESSEGNHLKVSDNVIQVLATMVEEESQ